MASTTGFGSPDDLVDVLPAIFDLISFNDKLRCQFVCKYWYETLRHPASRELWCEELIVSIENSKRAPGTHTLVRTGPCTWESQAVSFQQIGDDPKANAFLLWLSPRLPGIQVLKLQGHNSGWLLTEVLLLLEEAKAASVAIPKLALRSGEPAR